MFKKNRQGGFSLVELMVVVAIIGILATIAIPRVNKFIAKARQSEAQVNLSSFYTFNKNFYVEFQGYTNAFGSLGFMPEGNLRYNTGIGGAAAGPTNFVTLKGAFTGNTTSLVECPTNAAATARCRTLNGSDNNAPPNISVGALASPYDTFTCESIANLVSGSGIDRWTINQDKNLRNTEDGTDGIP